MRRINLPIWLRRFIKPHPQIPHPWSKYSAKDHLDKKLERYLDFDSGYFVELGAGDGVNLTNTRYFEENRNWTGVLIDPVVSNFISCRIHRKKSQSFLAACVSFDFQPKYVELIHAGYMSLAKDLESDIEEMKNHTEQALNYLAREEVGFFFPMYARTLDSILNEARAPNQIDLLSLDVEGAEIEVLKGINFKNYNFKYILVECRNVERTRDFLSVFGYEFVEKLANADYLFQCRM